MTGLFPWMTLSTPAQFKFLSCFSSLLELEESSTVKHYILLLRYLLQTSL